MKRNLLLSLAMTAGCLAASAQGFVGSAEAKLPLPAHFDVSADVEYRTTDRLKHTDRWGVGAAIGYKPVKPLKLAVGYNFYQQFNPASTDRKDRDVNRYWEAKHRLSLSATGTLKLWKLEISLRERYQFTYRPDMLVPRFDEGVPAGNKTVDSTSKHVMRTRLQVSFKPYKKCRFEPYVSAELYSLVAGYNHTEKRDIGSNGTDKWRFTAGSSYRINKRNSVELFYRYSQVNDPDELDAAHQIGVSYSFRLK